MQSIIEAIKQWIEWFNSTPLPKDTADTILELLREAGTKLLALAREYITIIFGG